MNSHFVSFIELGRALAAEKGLPWDIPLDEFGTALDKVGWNLTALTGDVPPPTHYLRDLGPDLKALAILNSELSERNEQLRIRRRLTHTWQELIKAAVAEQLLFKRNATASVLQRIARPESPRVLRRLQLLRRWSHEQVEQVFPGSA